MAKSSSGASNKQLPYNKSIPLGIQHVLAMFAGNITVPIIIAGVFGQTDLERVTELKISKIGDYTLPFSSCVNPDANKFYYYQPRIDKYWKAALEILSNDRKKLKKNIIAIYTGKGRISKLPLEIKKLFQDNELILEPLPEPPEIPKENIKADIVIATYVTPWVLEMVEDEPKNKIQSLVWQE